jgi:hypothetical protein
MKGDGKMSDACYNLMNLDMPVVNLVLNKGRVLSSDVLNERLCPWGTQGGKNIEHWFESRRIPASREHLGVLIEQLDTTAQELVQKSMGLSLADSFWLCPVGSDLTWASVNFFENDFTDDIGEYLMTEGEAEISGMFTPSNSTDGVMKKKWIIKTDFRYLIKKESGTGYRHLNEVLATKIAETLELPHVPYYRLGDDMCMCPCHIKPGQNLVTAYQYLLHNGMDITSYAKLGETYEPLCKIFSKKWLDGMLMLDYIIMNSDRHPKNFGLIQDSVIMEIIQPFPIFDNGNSLFHGIGFARDNPFGNLTYKARPFRGTHDLQIQLVDLSPFKEGLNNLDAIIQDLVYKVFEGVVKDEYADGMSVLLRQRVRNLSKMANQGTKKLNAF